MTFSTEIITVIVGQGALSNSVTLLVTDFGFYFISSRVRWIQVEVSDKKFSLTVTKIQLNIFPFAHLLQQTKQLQIVFIFFLYV